ncbi:MAG TPA: hypothetical protein VLK59_15710 [Solirubrobacteraceae bacterium]|nr:hypothetical protein [Solirubrobacteraceae bacterium]
MELVPPLAGPGDPPEEHVAGGLHEPLALHDPLALVRVFACARMRGEHRGIRLLDLEEQRIVRRVAHQQDHHRLVPDGADAGDLAREVLVVVAVQHHAPVRRQGPGVVGQSLPDDLLEVVGPGLGRPHDHRWLLLDPVAAVDALRELRQRAQARPRLRLGDGLLRGRDRALARFRPRSAMTSASNRVYQTSRKRIVAAVAMVVR